MAATRARRLGAAQADLGPGLVAALDAGDMLGAIAGLPRQLTDGLRRLARERLPACLRAGTAPPRLRRRPTGVVVCGMGGSAIGADLVLAACPSCRARGGRARLRRLPAWVGPADAGRSRRATPATPRRRSPARTRGARARLRARVRRVRRRLAALAGEREPAAGDASRAAGSRAPPSATWRCRSSPRSEAAGVALTRPADDDVAEARGSLLRGRQRPSCGARSRPGPRATTAKALARRLHSRQAVVYGAGLTVPVARRWKGQINENAKAPGLLERTAGAGPQRAHGLDEPAARGGRQHWPCSWRTSRATSGCGAAPTLTAARARGARRRRASTCRARATRVSRACSRWSSSATTPRSTSRCSTASIRRRSAAIQDFKAKLAGGAGA